MKYLFVLTLFAVVAFFLYWRLRPYIRAARRFLGVMREVNRMREGAAPRADLPRQPERGKAAAGSGKLVRCAGCGTWTPAARAVSLRAGASYCSHACLERAADSPRRERQSAS
ncbi:MAG TPA: hypothetical protein VF668_02175 [Pyrinomonadaceae bacterium]